MNKKIKKRQKVINKVMLYLSGYTVDFGILDAIEKIINSLLDIIVSLKNENEELHNEIERLKMG